MKHYIPSLAKRVLGISFMSLLNMTSLWGISILSLWNKGPKFQREALTRAVSVFYVTTWWRYGRLRRCPVTWCEPQQRQIWEFSTRSLNLFHPELGDLTVAALQQERLKMCSPLDIFHAHPQNQLHLTDFEEEESFCWVHNSQLTFQTSLMRQPR